MRSDTPLDPETDPKAHRRAQVRAAKARHDARLREMTKLEQAAFLERESLGESTDPYTPQERQEAEALRALISDLEHRARTLNRSVIGRLGREADTQPAKAALLARFAAIRETRIDLPPF